LRRESFHKHGYVMWSNPVLAIVVPVYNEQDNLLSLLRDWQPVFREISLPYQLIFIDDGSTDESAGRLRDLQGADPSVEVITQANAGHGPAIVRGYRLALVAEWVFQIDSDHQLDTSAFPELWRNRDRYDLLLAERADKDASPGRQVVSAVSRWLVRALFGRGVDDAGSIRDVNSPYRLMRAGCLREALEKVPPGSFAPNILLTAWFVLKKRRIFTTATRPRGGALRRRSRLNGYFLRGAVRSAFQTLLFRIRW
jgi:dolichol-phosphate mannosyltransferase